MLKKLLLAGLLASSICSMGLAQGPRPRPAQLAWHEMEFYLFIHFGPNTFTDLEWGHGDEDQDVFFPAALDCDQWCRTAKAAGARGIIITAKHHDGFCLWPSQYSTHTVAQSKWQDGKGDVLKALSEACKAHDLKFGVYISPWDRNHPLYGTEAYNDIFVAMMEELFDHYGPIWELWWDGANGEGPNGKRQEYDWERFRRFVREKSPETLVFSDVGPDIRWVGNEQGIAGRTNWNYLDTDGFSPGQGGPPTDTLTTGNVFGKHWIPAECDVSIRPGWFFHEQENDKVKSPEALFSLYLKSVGRGANLLLNVPPDKRGLFHAADSLSLARFRQLIDENFREDLLAGRKAVIHTSNQKRATQALTDGNAATNERFEVGGKYGIAIKLKKNTVINCVALRESLATGQYISSAHLKLLDRKGKLLRSIPLTTIGRKRILTFPSTTVSQIELELTGLRGAAVLSEMAAFHIQEELVEE